MKIYNGVIKLSTFGNTDIIDITELVCEELNKSGIKDGFLLVFVPGATGAVTTIEYEEELVKDTKDLFKNLVGDTGPYRHNKTHTFGNASSHLRATLIGPSLVVPITNGRLDLGTWQQIVFIDFDNKPRDRKIIVKILGLTENKNK
ncbi:MAG: secondary thiamine-phosphate synthase enzyme YjbQ [Endomicrobia bacterium]|nr:secondary thiamine-phosphate synthase enzyme YjbQ [Endomicrobiia bacterium]